jgi:hypothetical protein
MLPFRSLDAATSTGPGAVKDLEGLFSHVTMQVRTTGAPNDFNVGLQGSLDGVAWTTLGEYSGSNAIVSSTQHLVRYVRANIAVLDTGTVTAYIASAP